MRLLRALHRSYVHARSTWLFPMYNDVSLFVLIVACVCLFLHVPSSSDGFLYLALVTVAFANWTKRTRTLAPS